MSLRFGSGWVVIYFLICSSTFICSAPQLRARDYTTFNPYEPLPFSVTPDTRFWVTFSPLQGRAALTVEVTRPRGRPASRCCVGAFQNSQRLEMCGAPRSGQRGWSTCTPSRVHIPDVLTATRKLSRKRGWRKSEGSVPGSRHLVRKSSTDEMRVSRYQTNGRAANFRVARHPPTICGT